ncbi:hypothetical protein LP419_29400 [Massilia sp. H-1]|nr:hypothetical protein LP419_29400 [Massilia sp. H-1]
MADSDNQPYTPPASQFSEVANEGSSTLVDLLVRFFSPALLSVTAIYLLGFVSSWPWYFIVVALCIAIALGLVFGEVWAKYLWYAIAASISVVWLGANAGLIWSLFLSLLRPTSGCTGWCR